jgi:hypothetical protein
LLRKDVDKRVLIDFGILSAGGLAGALQNSIASNPALTLVFAALLMFAGVTSLISVPCCWKPWWMRLVFAEPAIAYVCRAGARSASMRGVFVDLTGCCGNPAVGVVPLSSPTCRAAV